MASTPCELLDGSHDECITNILFCRLGDCPVSKPGNRDKWEAESALKSPTPAFNLKLLRCPVPQRHDNGFDDSEFSPNQ